MALQVPTGSINQSPKIKPETVERLDMKVISTIKYLAVYVTAILRAISIWIVQRVGSMRQAKTA